MSEVALQDEVLNLEVTEPASTGDFPPIPEGMYNARVRESAFEVSRRGAPMYALTLEIVDGEYRGRLQWHRRPVMASTAAFVKADLQALNVPVPRGNVNASDIARHVAREARGRLVTIKVGFGKGDYANRNEVKALLPADVEPEPAIDLSEDI
ncbi:MAG: DUF669 domain-containing protein [Armatimonadota bacterium]|nr:DUF669 domain-containing protein [Armatimonadota bacterium]